MIFLLAVLLLILAGLFAFFPRCAWYYVLSGHWGRNDLGAPSDAQLVAVRFACAVPLIVVRYLALG